MAKTYVQTPDHWERITRHMIHDKQMCLEKIIRADKCLLLDTCTIMQYANLTAGSNFFCYVQDTYDMILIPRIILMELASDDGTVKEEHLIFLEKLHSEIYIFDEEWCYHYLKLAFHKSDKELNKILINTMQFVKKVFNNCVDTFFEDHLQIQKYFKSTPATEVYTDFFKDIRSQKRSGDSMGEELTAFIVILMSNIQEVNPCKYELLSNDRNSYYGLSATKRYIRNKNGWDSFMCRTTCNTAYVLYRNGYMSKEEVKSFVSVSYTCSGLRCFGAGKNDLDCKEYTFSVDEFADIIESDNLFKVIY